MVVLWSGGRVVSFAGEGEADEGHAEADAAGVPLGKVLCVLGQTGAGKSKLAVELALALGGEVVNCDAMQVCAGLPIATAQIPEDEQQGVPHHMLGVVHPGTAQDSEFTVREFRDKALPIVEDILRRGKVPLLVGGSDYYLRALVSRALLDDQGETSLGEMDEAIDDDGDKEINAERVASSAILLTSAEISLPDPLLAHARLRLVDPTSANKIHPNNTRRVRRYLEIYDTTGTPASVVFAKQKKEAANTRALGNENDTMMRYRCLFFAMKADEDELDMALHRRVDAMVKDGLVRELELAAAAMTSDNQSRGAQQSIGFHEWAEYLKAKGFDLSGGNNSTDVGVNSHGNTDTVDTDTLDTLCLTATEAMKHDTCRLARRQLRRCKRLERVFGWRLFFLDSTATHRGLRLGDDVLAQSSWAHDVFGPALHASRALLAAIDSETKRHRDADADHLTGGELPQPEHKEWKEHRCDACDKTVRGEAERRAHFEGRRHLRRVAAMRKKQRGGHGTQYPGSKNEHE